MSAEQQLYIALSGHAPLAAIVSVRIWPDVIPEDGEFPAVVYARMGTEPVVTLNGALVAEWAEMNIGCWAATRGAADAAADAAIVALLTAGHGYVNRNAGFDAETGLFVSNVAVRILN
jgi:hypothetical protein